MPVDAVTRVPEAVAEPVREYAPGSSGRGVLEKRLDELAGEQVALPMTVGGELRFGAGERVEVVQPCHHAAKLGTYGNAGREDARLAVDAALAAGPEWRAYSFDDRAAVLLRAAELLAGPWRETVTAAVMLGESRTARQAELEVCRTVDGWRRSVRQGRELLAEQPGSRAGGWDRADHRPLGGFVHVASPSSVTAVTDPVLLGNTVVWQPAHPLAAHHLMRLLEAAGLPPGVVNHGQGLTPLVLTDPQLAGLHCRGPVPDGAPPRTVAEPAGRAFLLAHRSAEPEAVRSALLRGAFDGQGQAANSLARAYLPRGLWQRIKDEFLAEVDALAVGDVTDLTNFMGALNGRKTYQAVTAAIERAGREPAVELAAGGQYDEAIGWFVRPTVLVCGDVRGETFREVPAGPVLAVHVYEDARWAEVLEKAAAQPGAAGAVLARERQAIVTALEGLRFAADEVNVNDRPGSLAEPELRPWIATRLLRETFLPPTGRQYPHMR